MQLEKKVIIEIKTTDGKVLKVGDTVCLVASGYTIAGTFEGISKKGACIFAGVGTFSDVKFNIMPKTITAMYKADIMVCNDEKKGETEC